jgi:ATP-dependent Clp protease protease subunit
MKKKTKKRKTPAEIKVGDLLLKNRKLFLYDEVEPENMERLVKGLFALDLLNHKPIYLYLTSPGGSVEDGFSLINVIKLLKSPVITIVIGDVCSMAGLISIVGKTRLMSKNSFWMGHDMAGGIWGDYSGKVEYRAEFIKKCWKMIEDHLKKYTKLTDRDLETLRNGELWLNPEECLEKGIIDKII